MTVEGNIKVCALNTDTKSLGNIFKDSIHEILNTKRMNEIREGCKKMNLQNIVKIAHIKNCHLYWKINFIMKQIRIFDLKFKKKEIDFFKKFQEYF